MTVARLEVPLQVVFVRRGGNGRWGAGDWRAEAVHAPSGGSAGGRREEEMILEFHRTETQGYRANLESASPSVYIVLRPGPDGTPSEPFLATVCAYTAQDYADDADSRVDAVPMPRVLAARLEAFVRRHHRETPFRKRRRTPHRVREAFARPPERVREGGA